MSCPSRITAVLLSTAIVPLGALQGLGAVCPVPSGPHPTIQSAIDDPGCSEIVLAAQVFAESVTVGRDLTLRGASSATTSIEGRLTVQGGATELELEDLTVDATVPGVAGTWNQALNVEGGAEVNGRDVVVLNAGFDPFAIFSDGFESGDTSAWSTTVP